MTSAEFYERRDDRTSTIVREQAYSRARVAVTINPKEAGLFAHQVAFVLAVNLTARWARHLRLSDVHAPLDFRLRRPGAPGTLTDFALSVAKAADPFGDFDFGGRAHTYGLHIHVGSDPPPGAYPIAGDGWIAKAGTRVTITDTENPLGAALAASVGVAHVFKAAVGLCVTVKPISLSLWNLQGGNAAAQGPRFAFPDLGNALMVGCGAVGTAIAWLLPLVRSSANWVLVDGDIVDVSNLNRSPLFGFDDISKRKAKVIASYLSEAGINADGIDAWFDTALQNGLFDLNRHEIVVPVANDRNVRHLIQHHIPPLQVYGTTGRNWDAFLGRHVPISEDCLACRFPAQKTRPAFACGTGNLPTANAEAVVSDAALPFLPIAAATMAVAELAKLGDEGFPINENFACLDFLGALDDFVVTQRAARPDCICRHQSDVWDRIRRNTRFRRLSGGAALSSVTS
jgi:hypothetical protein